MTLPCCRFDDACLKPFLLTAEDAARWVSEAGPGLSRIELMAPGIDTRPDTDAIREAVTFGGYRLGSRTNVRGVEMLPPAVCACSTSSTASRTPSCALAFVTGIGSTRTILRHS